MVPQGHHVRPGGIEPLCLVRGNPGDGGVLAVDHRKMDILQPLQGAQASLQMGQPLFADYVADGQNMIDHGIPSPERAAYLSGSISGIGENCKGEVEGGGNPFCVRRARRGRPARGCKMDFRGRETGRAIGSRPPPFPYNTISKSPDRSSRLPPGRWIHIGSCLRHGRIRKRRRSPRPRQRRW